MTDALSQFVVPGTDPDILAGYRALAERALRESFGFEDEVCILDIETTGYDPERHRIIEVAACIMRGPEVIDRFEELADPGCPIPHEITLLTGIGDEEVASARSSEIVADALERFAGSRPLIAHNAAFDRAFLDRACGGAFGSGRWIDTLPLARIALPRLRSHRLADLAAAFDAPVTGPAHRAGADVDALAHVWRVARCGLADLPPELLTRLAGLASEVEWGLRGVLAHHAAAVLASPLDLKEARRRRVGADRADALLDAAEIVCACPSVEEVVGEFTAEGLAGRMYDGFEERSEQLEMAEAVTNAFASGSHAAIEAGTGVGKSIAYLVPAALFALRHSVGVGVATKTNALMDQLVYHELPRLAEVLPDELRWVALKGYDHYPCLRKLDRAAADMGASGAIAANDDAIAAVAVMLSWAASSSWGDLDQINLHWRRDLRSAVAASQADCTKKRCRYFPHLCYLHGVRRRATSAHIVVTNHALLFRDVVSEGAVLPPIRHWVVDEAHAAESEARSQLSAGTSHAELVAVLNALGSSRTGILSNLKRNLRGSDEAESALGSIARMEDEIVRCSTLSESLFGFVKDLAPLAGESGYDSAELRISAGVRDSGSWGTVDGVGRSLAKRLAGIVSDGRDLVTRLEALGGDFSDPRADVAGLLSRLAEQTAGLVTVLDGEDAGLCYSVELDKRPNIDAEKLRAELIDVGEVLAEYLYPRCESVVFCSATIATGASFDHFARSVGLDRLDAEAWTPLRLTSSFDFERQMAVFVPTDMPEPSERGYLDALELLLREVHVAMGGSVLTLFTNRRDLDRCFAALEPQLRTDGLSLIRQHRGTSAKRLRDEFLADERLSLMALKSFWEGFDAKGDTLRCVVVPRLPFGRPTDPLAQEREEREGRAAWSRYALPEAVIELKQAAGRLIRSTSDTGCVLIADSRVVSKAYGARFVEALPVADVERMPAERVIEAIKDRFGR
jgi:ATP-dependent DNA helicase DinG